MGHAINVCVTNEVKAKQCIGDVQHRAFVSAPTSSHGAVNKPVSHVQKEMWTEHTFFLGISQFTEFFYYTPDHSGIHELERWIIIGVCHLCVVWNGIYRRIEHDTIEHMAKFEHIISAAATPTSCRGVHQIQPRYFHALRRCER